MKKSIYNNTENLIMFHTTHHNIDQQTHRIQAKKITHTQAVQQHLLTIPDNSILNRPPPKIGKTVTELRREAQRLLAQLWPNKFPFPLFYLHHIDPTTHPSPSFPLCGMAEHNTIHLFNCPQLYTRLLSARTR